MKAGADENGKEDGDGADMTPARASNAVLRSAA